MGRTSAPRSGRDDEVRRSQARPVIDLDLVRRDEFGSSEKYVDAETFESLLGVVGLDLGASLSHTRKDVLELEGRLQVAQSQLARSADTLDELGRRDQRFGRDAAVVQTVAAHLLRLDERHSTSESHGPRRRDEPGRSRADDDDVVAARAFFFPLGH